MALIFELGLNPVELRQISDYLCRPERTAPPHLSDIGQKALNGLFESTDQVSYRLGSFVDFDPVETGGFRSPTGTVVDTADVLYDTQRLPTGRRGFVYNNYLAPKAAYQIIVPYTAETLGAKLANSSRPA